MNRRKRLDSAGQPTGEWEVLVNTPSGFVWQLESLPTPGAGGRTSEHWSAVYNPMGRQAGVPASAYRGSAARAPYKNMFDDILGGLIGQNQPLAGRISKAKRGGQRKPYAEEFPYYKTPLYLKKKRGPF
jgi:hypothetical protein